MRRSVLDGVEDVIIYTNPDAPEKFKNRGFCFVDFVDHKSASDAKRRFTQGGKKQVCYFVRLTVLNKSFGASC